MHTNLEKLIENNWDELKDQVRSNWDKLSAQDIKQIEGSYDILIGKLKKTYGKTRKEIEESLEDFFSSDEEYKEKKDAIINGTTFFKDTVGKFAEFYFQCAKDKSTEFERSVVSYAKENPLKILGTAAVICFTVNKIFQNKDFH